MWEKYKREQKRFFRTIVLAVYGVIHAFLSCWVFLWWVEESYVQEFHFY